MAPGEKRLPSLGRMEICNGLIISPYNDASSGVRRTIVRYGRDPCWYIGIDYSAFWRSIPFVPVIYLCRLSCRQQRFALRCRVKNSCHSFTPHHRVNVLVMNSKCCWDYKSKNLQRAYGDARIREWRSAHSCI